MVELDAERAARLIKPTNRAESKEDVYSPASVWKKLARLDFDQASRNAVGYALASLYKRLDALGFQSGAEFVTAISEADNIGARILLGDQDARITLGRLRDATRDMLQSGTLSAAIVNADIFTQLDGDPALRRLAEASKLGSSGGQLTREGVLSSLEVLQQRDAVRTLVQYMREYLPPLHLALIAERDAAMSRALLSVEGASHCTVAVVGLAHVDGISANLGAHGYMSFEC